MTITEAVFVSDEPRRVNLTDFIYCRITLYSWLDELLTLYSTIGPSMHCIFVLTLPCIGMGCICFVFQVS